jgi:hypothetical protein
MRPAPGSHRETALVNVDAGQEPRIPLRRGVVVRWRLVERAAWASACAPAGRSELGELGSEAGESGRLGASFFLPGLAEPDRGFARAIDAPSDPGSPDQPISPAWTGRAPATSEPSASPRRRTETSSTSQVLPPIGLPAPGARQLTRTPIGARTHWPSISPEVIMGRTLARICLLF